MRRKKKYNWVWLIAVAAAAAVTIQAGVSYHRRTLDVTSSVDEVSSMKIGNITIIGAASEEMKEAAKFLNDQGYSGSLSMRVSDEQDITPEGIKAYGFPVYYELYEPDDDVFECVKKDGAFVVWGINDPFPETLSSQDAKTAQELEGNVAKTAQELEGNVIVKAKVPDNFQGNILVSFIDTSMQITRLYLTHDKQYLGAIQLKEGEPYQFTGTLTKSGGKYELKSGNVTPKADGKTQLTLYLVEAD